MHIYIYRHSLEPYVLTYLLKVNTVLLCNEAYIASSAYTYILYLTNYVYIMYINYLKIENQSVLLIIYNLLYRYIWYT